ncbi:MAG: hypothetical protein JXB48_04535 [Candidatus Latescibacteria bacterium]|nr:hypothetical protein [Candidatus Latescibacterota bacterium]
MTQLDKFGFLSKEVDNSISQTRSKYKDYFALSEEMNKFGYSLLFEIFNTNCNESSTNNDAKFFILKLLFTRVLNTFDGIVVLLERGMQTQATMLLRCMIETMYVIEALNNDEDFIKDYLKHDEAQKLIMKIKGYEADIIKKSNNYNQSEYDKLKNAYNKKRNNLIKTGKLVEKANLTDFHKMTYNLLSQATHPTIFGLEEEFLNKTDNGKIEIYVGPSKKNIERTFETSFITIIMVSETVTQMFDINHQEEINIFNKRINGFYDLKEN